MVVEGHFWPFIYCACAENGYVFSSGMQYDQEIEILHVRFL